MAVRIGGLAGPFADFASFAVGTFFSSGSP